MPLNANEVDAVMKAAALTPEGEIGRAIWIARGTRIDALPLTNERLMGVDLFALSSTLQGGGRWTMPGWQVRRKL